MGTEIQVASNGATDAGHEPLAEDDRSEVVPARAQKARFDLKRAAAEDVLGAVIRHPRTVRKDRNEAVVLRERTTALQHRVAVHHQEIEREYREASQAIGAVPVGPAREPLTLKATAAHEALQAALDRPDDEYDKLVEAIDRIQERASALHEAATRDESLAQAGIAVAQASSAKLDAALKYHQTQSTVTGAGILVVLGVASFVVLWIFGDAANMADPHGIEDAAFWLRGILLFGGRISVLAGFGWSLSFLGRLHSKHAQQAVWYQDRLVGLESAQVLISYGTASVREDILRRMTTTFLSLDTNAFKDPPPPPGMGTKDVARLLKSGATLLAAAQQKSAK